MIFSNDMRVANTATPSFNTEVNVGLMGWTQVDKSSYNQLIQYVDLCEKLYQDMSDQLASALDVTDKALGLVPKLNQAIESVPIIGNTAAQVAADKVAVDAAKVSVDATKIDFDTKYLAFQQFVTPVTDDLDLQADWSRRGPPYDDPKSVNIMNNVVYLKGSVIGELLVDQPNIAILKSAYRPKGVKIVPVISAGGFVALQIEPSGLVKVIPLDGTSPFPTYRGWVSLDCSFTL